MTAEQNADQGAGGFHVTVKRGSRTGYLLGPHGTYDEASARVPKGRRIAGQAGPFTAFDGFGVTRVRMHLGVELPPGVLNEMATGRHSDLLAARYPVPARRSPVLPRLPLPLHGAMRRGSLRPGLAELPALGGDEGSSPGRSA